MCWFPVQYSANASRVTLRTRCPQRNTEIVPVICCSGRSPARCPALPDPQHQSGVIHLAGSKPFSYQAPAEQPRFARAEVPGSPQDPCTVGSASPD